jgi:hypothetical protein
MKSVVNFFWSQKPLESLKEKKRKLILTLALSNSRDPFRKKSCLLDSSSVSSNSVYVVVPKRALKAKSCRDPTTYHAVRIGGALTILRHQIPSRNHLYHQLPLRHHGHFALTVLLLLLLLSQNATKNSPEKTRFSSESLPTKHQRERSHAEKQSGVHPPSSSDLNCGYATVSSSPFTELIRTQGSTQTRQREREREKGSGATGQSKLPTCPMESPVES